MTDTAIVQHADADTLNQYAALLGLTPDQLAPDTWATETTFSKRGPCVEHGRTLEPVHGFTARISRLVVEDAPGAPEVIVTWGEGFDAEEFVLGVDQIPGLIDALSTARHACGSGVASETALPNALQAMRAIEDQRAALAARRDELLRQLVSDLEWMDIPVHRLRGFGVLRITTDTEPGARVHLVHEYQENGPYDRTEAHLLDDCGWYCGGPGNTVKGGGRQKRRYHCLGEFEYIGTTDTDGHTDYLFTPVKP